jgi:hypothetical protein
MSQTENRHGKMENQCCKALAPVFGDKSEGSIWVPVFFLVFIHYSSILLFTNLLLLAINNPRKERHLFGVDPIHLCGFFPQPMSIWLLIPLTP